MATSQTVALPVVIFVYARMPAYVPAAFASILGAHFLPYVWLQQSPVYLVLGVAVSLGAWVIMMVYRDKGYKIVPLFVGFCLLTSAAILSR